MAIKEKYLGDGLYAVWNGFQFVLKANDNLYPSDIVYLELDVLKSLIEFVEDNLDPNVFKTIIK